MGGEVGGADAAASRRGEQAGPQVRMQPARLKKRNTVINHLLNILEQSLIIALTDSIFVARQPLYTLGALSDAVVSR